MKNNKTLGLVAWGIGLVLSLLLLFCLATAFTASFWCTLIFVVVAAVSSLIFQMKSWQPNNRPKESVLHISLLTVAIGYMMIQIPVAVAMALSATVISWRVSLLINGVICALAWLMGIGALVGNDHIDKVNKRQHTNGN